MMALLSATDNTNTPLKLESSYSSVKPDQDRGHAYADELTQPSPATEAAQDKHQPQKQSHRLKINTGCAVPARFSI